MKDFLSYSLFRVGAFSLTVSQLVYVVILIAVTYLLLQILRGVLNRYKKFDDGQRFTVYTMTKYFAYIVVFSASLRLLGIDISVIVVSSAGLFVGIGLGLQGLFHDFVSGIILLVEGTIKAGSVIQIGEKRVEVLEIKFRTSVVKTRDEKEIVVPNSYLTKNEIINWSNQRNLNRHSIDVRVAIEDVERAMAAMKQIVQKHPKVLAKPEPYVRIEQFAEYAVELKVLFWSEEVFAVGRMLGEIRLLILHSFRENNISLPFPKQVVSIMDREQKKTSDDDRIFN
ncbi:MAG: mechanosensitive ion channel [Bacteroidetes bacterium]|nr:mechanosensitive ion channel [Bacteroidota bacterium]